MIPEQGRDRHDGWAAGRLGTLLGLNSAGTTALVDRLERLGHVRRVRDARDRRRVLIELDERAVELGWASFGPLINRSVELLRGYDERELAAIRGFLGGVRDAAATAERLIARVPFAPMTLLTARAKRWRRV